MSNRSFRKRVIFANVVWVALAMLNLADTPAALSQSNAETSLDGKWQVSLDSEKTWQPILVPGAIEDQVDINFDGVSIYRRQFVPPPIGKDERLWLHFDAVATSTEVWINDQKIGRHLGAWTPFRFDITPFVNAAAEKPLRLKVVCDEKVGHNTQGFLPVFAPHFGGIWQSVRLLKKPSVSIDDLQFGCHFDTRTMKLHLEIPMTGRAYERPQRFKLFMRPPNQPEWFPLNDVVFSPDQKLDDESNPVHVATHQSDRLVATVSLPIADSGFRIADKDFWTLSNPVQHEIRLELLDADGKTVDRQQVRIGLRSLQVLDDKILVNGSPVIVRGMLNWGYAPPLVTPSLDEEFMRNEIQMIKDRGFNLMKFCLWVPPRRYLELCDEMGVYAWVEYPTWHPKFNQQTKTELLTEYDEFYHFDRRHVSIILRSLTCETGPSADLNVIQSLYNLCKKRIPDSIVEDDSSWIGWNRIHDFYDDHPYGNNHTWPATLDRLQKHIADRVTKPLILGESISADTWADPNQILARNPQDSSSIHWHPNFLKSSQRWLNDWRQHHNPRLNSLRLFDESKRYAMLMRKYQIEKFRERFPFGGYVVSVVRDVPLCSMGFIDYLGQNKYLADDWQWHRESILSLKTENDRRCFLSGQNLSFDFFANSAHSGKAKVVVDFEFPNDLAASKHTNDRPRPTVLPVDLPGALQRTVAVPIKQQLPEVTSPTTFNLNVTLLHNGKPIAKNTWPLWIAPKASFGQKNFYRHTSVDVAATSFPQLQSLPLWGTAPNQSPPPQSNHSTVFTTQLDQPLLELAKSGSKIVLLADDSANGIATESYWFLRGGPLVHPSVADRPTGKMLVDLQHFDLASDVIADVHDLKNCDHFLSLWETHDLDETRVNGLVIHFPIGRGHLVVSSANHRGGNNPAGQFLLKRMLANDWMTAADRNDKNFHRFSNELKRRQHPLSQTWNFSDQEQANWQFPTFNENETWKPISVDRHWDSQGYGALDGWGYYRTQLVIDEEWNEDETYLSFTGVDDYYEVFVNGVKIGSGGDLENRITAFEERKSYDISRFALPGKTLTIAVKVYDWQGAGGIFRPVSISNQPYSNQRRLLK